MKKQKSKLNTYGEKRMIKCHYKNTQTQTR